MRPAASLRSGYAPPSSSRAPQTFRFHNKDATWSREGAGELCKRPFGRPAATSPVCRPLAVLALPHVPRQLALRLPWVLSNPSGHPLVCPFPSINVEATGKGLSAAPMRCTRRRPACGGEGVARFERPRARAAPVLLSDLHCREHARGGTCTGSLSVFHDARQARSGCRGRPSCSGGFQDSSPGGKERSWRAAGGQPSTSAACPASSLCASAPASQLAHAVHPTRCARQALRRPVWHELSLPVPALPWHPICLSPSCQGQRAASQAVCHFPFPGHTPKHLNALHAQRVAAGQARRRNQAARQGDGWGGGVKGESIQFGPLKEP